MNLVTMLVDSLKDGYWAEKKERMKVVEKVDGTVGEKVDNWVVMMAET